jgi:hypothetical protein
MRVNLARLMRRMNRQFTWSKRERRDADLFFAALMGRPRARRSEDESFADETQQVDVTVGTRRMRITVGALEFNTDARDDVMRGGALLSGPDQARIGFARLGPTRLFLGYDATHTSPVDPFRWSKLKEMIDADLAVLIRKTPVLGPISSLFIRGTTRTTMNDLLRANGLTLPTEALHTAVYPSAPDRLVSTDASVSHLHYSTSLSGVADSSLSHELFGHMWLAFKRVPFLHPSQNNPIAVAQIGTLTAAHNILDPFGNVFTGPVETFIDRFIGSRATIVASPTLHVGPQLLLAAVQQFEALFPAQATGTMNGPWSVPNPVGEQFEYISNNHAAAPPRSRLASPPPAIVPTDVNQAIIERYLAAWYGVQTPVRQYIFLRFVRSLRNQSNRVGALASTLASRLTPPAGMSVLGP